MIPDYQTLMRPVLESAVNGEAHIHDVVAALANRFKLSEEDRNHLLPNGKQRTFDYRVNWAKSYLNNAGLVRITRRGYFELTGEGRKALEDKTAVIDNQYLTQFERFQRKHFTSAKLIEALEDAEAYAAHLLATKIMDKAHASHGRRRSDLSDVPSAAEETLEALISDEERSEKRKMLRRAAKYVAGGIGAGALYDALKFVLTSAIVQSDVFWRAGADTFTYFCRINPDVTLDGLERWVSKTGVVGQYQEWQICRLHQVIENPPDFAEERERLTAKFNAGIVLLRNPEKWGYEY